MDRAMRNTLEGSIGSVFGGSQRRARDVVLVREKQACVEDCRVEGLYGLPVPGSAVSSSSPSRIVYGNRPRSGGERAGSSFPRRSMRIAGSATGGCRWSFTGDRSIVLRRIYFSLHLFHRNQPAPRPSPRFILTQVRRDRPWGDHTTPSFRLDLRCMCVCVCVGQ